MVKKLFSALLLLPGGGWGVGVVFIPGCLFVSFLYSEAAGRALCSPASGVPPGWQFSIPRAGIWHQMESLGIEAAEAPSLLNSRLEWQVVGMAHGSHLGPGWGRAACFRLTVAFGALTRELAHSLRWGSQKAPPASSMESVTPTRPPHTLVGCLGP